MKGTLPRSAGTLLRRNLMMNSDHQETTDGMDSINDSSILMAKPNHRPLSIVHLPESIQTSAAITPGLWSWMNIADPLPNDPVHLREAEALECLRRSVSETRILSPNGLTLLPTQSLRELAESSSNLARRPNHGNRPMSMAAPAAESNETRNKVLKTPSNYTSDVTRRVFFHLSEITLKKNSTNPKPTFVVVTCNGQKVSSKTIMCHKDINQKHHLATPREAFLFDINVEEEEYTVNIELHSGSSLMPTDLQHSASIESFVSNGTNSSSRPGDSVLKIFNTLRKGVLNNNNNNNAQGGSHSSSLIGEVKVKINKHPEFVKTVESHSIMTNDGKKELAKLLVQTGIYFDEPEVEEEVVKESAEGFSDYLNVHVRYGNSAAKWKKYWVKIQKCELHLYDFEYQERKPLIAIIPGHEIISIEKPPTEIICAPLCMQLLLTLTYSSKILSNKDISNPQNWTRNCIDKIPDLNEPAISATLKDAIIITAESSDGFCRWVKALCNMKEEARIMQKVKLTQGMNLKRADASITSMNYFSHPAHPARKAVGVRERF